MTKKATIVHRPTHVSVAQLTEAINDMGYEATTPAPTVYVVNIDGMTCASCVGKVMDERKEGFEETAKDWGSSIYLRGFARPLAADDA